MNKVIIIGNLGQDPDIRFSQSGDKIASLSVATTESWKDKASGERKSITEWHRVVVFNENISNVIEQYVKKGDKICVEGAIKTRKYTGTDGVEKNITEIVISQFKGGIELLGSKGDSQESDSLQEKKQLNAKQFENRPVQGAVNIANDLDDEIPF
jgi:single-strand DNA-binding protein